jgi:phage anti-repressor protein
MEKNRTMSMNELIKISAQRTVDARELHTFLQVGKDFSTWIKDRIAKYGFEAEKDFTGFSPNLGKTSEQGGRPTTEYALSIGMAKELSMVENNEQGRKARRYFIAAEERLQSAKPMTVEESILHTQTLLAARMQRVEEHVGLTTQRERSTAKAVGIVIEHLQSARPALPTEADIPDGMLCPWDYLGEVEPETRNEKTSKGVAREAAKLYAGFAYGAGPKANWPRTAYPRDILEEAHRRYAYNLRYGRTEE